jgi:signal peptidase I
MERCVAIEGDLVEFRDQVFYLNGKAQGEPPPAVHGMPGARIPEPVASEYTVPFRIPEGTVFCLGDNRCNSYDSRYWGPLRRESIRGKVIYVYLAKGPGHRDLATP